MCLVKFEIGRCQYRQSNHRQNENEEPPRARCARAECRAASGDRALPLGSAIKLGWRAKICGAHFRPARLQINSNKPSKSSVSPPARKNVATTSLGQCEPR